MKGVFGLSIRLVAFDLDGTMLDDNKKLTAENLGALTEAADSGVVLVPATGRIYPAIPDFLRNLSFIRYYILANGACVYDSVRDEVIHRGEISSELSLRCVKYMDTLPVIYDCYQENKGYMTESMYNRAEKFFPDQPHMIDLVKRLRKPVPDLYEFLKDNGQGVQKLQMFFMEEDMELRETQLRTFSQVFPELVATSSVKNNIEINSADGGKGSALAALAQKLGIALEDTAAFGDGTNDIEMLKTAGCGVAMENAAEKVKAAADMITADNNHSGVGKGIKLLLNNRRLT